MLATPVCNRPSTSYVEGRRRKLAKERAGAVRGRGLPAATGGAAGEAARESSAGVTLCLNGGGNLALSGAYGLLRGLSKKGALNQCDSIVGVSGGFWATAIYLYGSADADSEEEASAALLDTARSDTPAVWKAEENMDSIPKETLGYSAVYNFGVREIFCLPLYCFGQGLSRLGLGSISCHKLWVQSIQRSFLSR